MAALATFEVTGLRDIDEALGQFSKGVARGVARRALLAAAEPVAGAIREAAPLDTGQLRDSIKAVIARVKGGGPLAEVNVVAFAKGHAHLQEFGTQHHAAQPFIRPGWEATKGRALEIIRTQLWLEISKAAERAARKAARAARAGS
jgi:HK97 gp10 family phage protein